MFYPNTYGGRVANLHHNELKIVYWYTPTALGFEKTETSASGFKKTINQKVCETETSWPHEPRFYEFRPFEMSPHYSNLLEKLYRKKCVVLRNITIINKR